MLDLRVLKAASLVSMGTEDFRSVARRDCACSSICVPGLRGRRWWMMVERCGCGKQRTNRARGAVELKARATVAGNQLFDMHHASDLPCPPGFAKL